MNPDLFKYIESGLTITKSNSGYSVYANCTGWFEISNLIELTPEKFEEQLQKILDNYNSQIIEN